MSKQVVRGVAEWVSKCDLDRVHISRVAEVEVMAFCPSMLECHVVFGGWYSCTTSYIGTVFEPECLLAGSHSRAMTAIRMGIAYPISKSWSVRKSSIAVSRSGSYVKVRGVLCLGNTKSNFAMASAVSELPFGMRPVSRMCISPAERVLMLSKEAVSSTKIRFRICLCSPERSS